MKRLFLLCLTLVASVALAETPAANKWEKDIAAFEKADKATPPPASPILFVGSSSIRKWTTLEQDFPGLPVINRGFGGSQMSDVLNYFDRVVAAYKPQAIVVYEGDNDLGGKKSPAQVFADFKTFIGKVREKLGDTPIYIIAVKPSLKRLTLMPQQAETNKMIKDFATTQKNVTFVDIVPAMLNAEGQPRKELLVSDGLHMTPEGYAIWTKAIDPLIRK